MKCSIKKKVTSAVFALALGLFGVVVPVVGNDVVLKAQATKINDCGWSFDQNGATNVSCFEVRHLVVVGNTIYPAPWVTQGERSTSVPRPNMTGYGIDVWVASPETVYHELIKRI
ncbi:MAG: hypothetical protein LBI63_05040 [Candidatus Ancillula sp.]|jgi:hypothetical protein|nr:hypothetical protein [Candidatus Ancillula sp.]